MANMVLLRRNVNTVFETLEITRVWGDGDAAHVVGSSGVMAAVAVPLLER